MNEIRRSYPFHLLPRIYVVARGDHTVVLESFSINETVCDGVSENGLLRVRV